MPDSSSSCARTPGCARSVHLSPPSSGSLILLWGLREILRPQAGLSHIAHQRPVGLPQAAARVPWLIQTSHLDSDMTARCTPQTVTRPCTRSQPTRTYTHTHKEGLRPPVIERKGWRKRMSSQWGGSIFLKKWVFGAQRCPCQQMERAPGGGPGHTRCPRPLI